MEAAFHFWLFLPLCVCAASCAAGWPRPCSAPCCHRGSELLMSQPQPQTRSHLAATARFVPVALGEPTLLRRGQAETPNAQLQVPCVPTAQAVTRTWPNAPCPPPAPCRWAPCGTLNPQPHLSSSTCPATPGSLASSNHPAEHPPGPSPRQRGLPSSAERCRDNIHSPRVLPSPSCHRAPLAALVNNPFGLQEHHSSPCLAQKINDALMDAEGKANQSGTYRFMIARPHY